MRKLKGSSRPLFRKKNLAIIQKLVIDNLYALKVEWNGQYKVFAFKKKIEKY